MKNFPSIKDTRNYDYERYGRRKNKSRALLKTIKRFSAR